MASPLTPKAAGAPPPPRKSAAAAAAAAAGSSTAPAPALTQAQSRKGTSGNSYASAGARGANIPTPSVIKFDDDVDYKRAEKLNRRKGRKTTGGGFFASIWNLIFKAGIVYLLVGAFWTCGSRPFKYDYSLKDDRSHCRALARGKLHLEPVVAPYLNAASAKVDEYTKPYVDVARPYATRAWKTARPYYRYANKQGQRYYKNNVDPVRRKAIKRARQYSDPHIKTATQHYNKQVQPHVDNFQRAVKPYQDIYRRDVAPYLDQAYAQSLAFGSASYGVYVSRFHPIVVRSLNQVHAFYVNHFDPAVRRAYALYIRPQVNKALEKVFGHKAHALTSDALKDVKQDVKQAAKDGKANQQQKVSEAKASASRAVNDPTLADRVNIAKDHVTGGPLAAEDPVASAAADAELSAEQATVKEQLEAWEKGLAHLIEEEYKLALERITQIRHRFSESLPDRFNILTEDVETEVEGIFARLLKAFGKLNASDDNINERLSTGKAAIEKQQLKLERSRGKSVESLQGLHAELQQEEAVAQKASVDEISRYISEAQKSYRSIIGSTRFPQTKAEWQGWDNGIAVRSQLFSEELDDVRRGSKKVAPGVAAIDPGHEGDVQRQISKLVKQVETLYDTALAELAAFSSKELSGLGAKGATAAAAAAAAAAAGGVLESVAGSAQKLTGEAREVLQEAAGALSGDAGSGAASILSSRASEASASASSIARQGAKTVGLKPSPESPGEYLEDFTSRASDYAQQAASAAGASSVASAASSIARQGAKSAGLKPSPESPGEYIEDFTSRAGEYAQHAASAASAAGTGASGSAASLASSASSIARQGAKSAGLKPSPESPGEYVEDVASRASGYAQQAVSAAGAGSAASAASSIARQGAKSAGLKPSPESPGEYVEDFTSRAGDAAQQAASSISEVAEAAKTGLAVDRAHAASSASSVAREAAKTIGLNVQPETPREYAEAAAGVVADGAGIAASEASSVLRQATRSVASAAGARVTPETPDEYVEAVTEGAASLASELSSGASSVVSSASSGAASVASSASSAGESAASAASSYVDDLDASETLHHATRSLASAVGLSQTPETVSEYVEAAGDALHKGTRSAASAAGIKQTPETASEYVEAAGDAAESVLSQATSLASDAQDAVHHATRSAASAAGFKPTPESAGEYVEAARDAVESAGGQASEAIAGGAQKMGIRDEL